LSGQGEGFNQEDREVEKNIVIKNFFMIHSMKEGLFFVARGSKETAAHM
jgi:hypothetical protein